MLRGCDVQMGWLVDTVSSSTVVDDEDELLAGLTSGTP